MLKNIENCAVSLSRSPKRFDPYFIHILAHNLKLYSIHTEGVAADARHLEVVPEADDEAKVSICSLLLSHHHHFFCFDMYY